LEPGVVIKPQMDQDLAKQLLRDLYGLEPLTCKEFNSYDDRNFYFTVSSESKNSHLPLPSPDGYVLKITNSQDSKDPDFSDAQNLMILHMAKSLPVPVPVQNVHGSLKSLESIGKTKNIVRLLKYIPGKILYEVPDWTEKHFYQCGQFVARMSSTLADFEHPAYLTRQSVWFLSSIPSLTKFISAVEDEGRKKLAECIIKEFCSTVKPVEKELDSGIIHGDFNEQNILVKQVSGGEFEVYSVLDFGDSQRNPMLYDLAINIMYMMTQCRCIEPYKAGGHVVAGYLNHRDLSQQEKQLLRICVGARYAQSLVLGTYSYQQDPGNDYLLTTTRTGWTILADFWKVPIDTLYRDWDQTILDAHPSKSGYMSSSL